MSFAADTKRKKTYDAGCGCPNCPVKNVTSLAEIVHRNLLNGGLSFLHFLFRKHLNRKSLEQKPKKNKILYEKIPVFFYGVCYLLLGFGNHLHPTGPRGHDMTPTHSACAIIRRIPQNYHQCLIPPKLGGIYTTWKVDGATPMYWFIMAPY